MIRAVRAIAIALALAAAAAGGSAADVLPGPGPRPPGGAPVTGIVRGFAGASLALRDAKTGATTQFELLGPLGTIRADSIGLRLGDTATVAPARGANNRAISVDRVLPDGRTTIRVFARDLPAAAPAIGRGQGCWVPAQDGAGIELCFTSQSRGVALRYGAEGAFACAAALRREGERFAAAPEPCRDGLPWPLQEVACDDQGSCRLILVGRLTDLTMTRR